MKYRKENSIIDSIFSIDIIIIEQLKQLVESYEECAQDFNSEPVFESPGNRYFSNAEYPYRLLEKNAIIKFQELILGETKETSITTSGSNSLKGILLYADDSVAIMWNCNDEYDWRMSDSCISVVRAKDVSNINFHKHGSFWTGAWIGGISSMGTLLYCIFSSGNFSAEADAYGPGFLIEGAILVGSICGGTIGGLISNLISWNDSYTINGDQNIFIQHLKEIKHYSLFLDKAPPEIFRKRNSVN